MNTIRLAGDDRQLYHLVAYLIMDEKVLEYNLGYPFKTSSSYCWFVARDNDRTLGFIPVRLEDGKAKINNYWVDGDDPRVFTALLKEAVRAFSSDYQLESATQLRHIPDFERNGFSIVFYWKKYAKMKAFRDNEKKCL